MQRSSVWAFWGAVLLVGNCATAGSAVPRQTQNRRQLADCMTKHMAASRTLSYNEAAQLCKDQLRTQRDGLSASNQPKPANVR